MAGLAARKTRVRFKRWEFKRRGLIPRTLIDCDTAANRAEGLNVIAGAMRALMPCWADTLARIARQMQDNYTAAQAVSNLTDRPTWSINNAETPKQEITTQEQTIVERPFNDTTGWLIIP